MTGSNLTPRAKLEQLVGIVADQARFAGWGRRRVRRELLVRGLELRASTRRSASTWYRAVRRVMGRGVRTLGKPEQLALFAGRR